MKKIVIVFLALFTFYIGYTSYGFSQPSAVEEEPTTETALSWPEIVTYAKKNLPQEGILVQNPDGFAYLKVDDRYIHDLFPLLGLEKEGFTEPPYFRSKTAPGAHISIFYVDEKVVPEEVGQTFPFKLENIVIVKPTKDTSYAVLQVASPELEALRKKYGLSPKLHGHEYHISIAKKKGKR